MSYSHVVLIGAGQLGSRHLQAIANCSSNINVTVIDPSPHSLSVAEARLNEVILSPSIGSVSFLKNLKDLNESVDCCIIATNAKYRFAVLKELLALVSVKNIVFEKVLFQSTAQIDEATALLSQYDVNAWVNCPRRMQPIYQQLYKLLEQEASIDLEAIGTNWDVACNGIHLIDLWAYLGEGKTYTLSTDALSSELIESKRSGYIEVTGKLMGVSDGGSFSLKCTKEINAVALKICIKTPNYNIEVDESNGKCKVINVISGTIEITDFSFLYQSQLSNIVVDEILTTQQCTLTPYTESALLHKPFLETLLAFINENGSEKFNVCPIT